MFGISSTAKDAVSRVVDDVFDRFALNLLGNIPRLAFRKLLVFNAKPKEGLAHLFLEAMGNRPPSAIESDALKSMLVSSHGYIDSIKAKTRSNVAERIDGLARQAKITGDHVAESAIQEVIQEELGRAQTHMKTIVESESTKFRNVGSAMDISKVAAAQGEEDPTVFFVVMKDGNTCKECLRLHLNADGTPRLWKFSEIQQAYHKRGGDKPSAFGLHPHCRCTLTYLVRGFGFDAKGKVAFKAMGHDEFAKQRAQD